MSEGKKYLIVLEETKNGEVFRGEIEFVDGDFVYSGNLTKQEFFYKFVEANTRANNNKISLDKINNSTGVL